MSNSLFTQVRVAMFHRDSLRGIATVKVADAVYLTGLRIIEGKTGLFVAMPSKKDSSGEYQDIYFPASKAHRDDLQACVLAAYHKELATEQAEEQAAAGK